MEVVSRRYADTDNSTKNLSASQVKTASKCGLQYWYRYIEGAEATKADSDYITLGSRVHDAIEETLKHDRCPPLGEEEMLRSAIQNTYRELDDEYPLPNDLYSDGMDCCEKAAKYLAKREPDLRGIEKFVEFEINRPDMETGVTGIMDICTQSEIWDWKTGRIRDETAHEEKIQGSLYMAAYYHEFDEEPEKIRFVYVKEGKVRSLDPSDENWQYMIARAKKLLEMKESGEWPANPGDHCYWCSYEFWCPAAPAGHGNVPYEEY